MGPGLIDSRPQCPSGKGNSTPSCSSGLVWADVSVGVCGCVGMWASGRMDVWVCGHVGVWTCERVGVWMCRPVDL